MAINSNLQYWNNGKAVITQTNPDILNLTHWNNGKSFGDLVYLGESFSNNQVSGKINILYKNIDNLDAKTFVTSTNINNLDAKIFVTSTNINNLDGEIIIISNPTSFLNGKLNIKDQILFNLDGKIILQGISVNSDDALDGRIEIIDVVPIEIDIKWESGEPNANIRDFRFLNLTYWKNGIQVGDLLYQTNETGVEYNLMNGRLNLEDSNLFNLDSKLIINSPIEINNLFDGKISPQTLAVGRVKIKIF